MNSADLPVDEDPTSSAMDVFSMENAMALSGKL